MGSDIARSFSSVYGPVDSWRFGRSLGIDPIGAVSTCSFNCAYCQLGAIDRQSCDRHVFVPTTKIHRDLQSFALADVNTITLSGSGEPTLAQNLGEILTVVRDLTSIPVGVLTNGSMLADRTVRQELALADWVAIKVDAVTSDRFRRINAPLPNLDLLNIWEGFCRFRQIYSGHLAIQTMVLSPWSEYEQVEYIRRLKALSPHEIQLNTPTRPRPLTHQLIARGNHAPVAPPYPTRQLRRVDAAVLQSFADRIERATGIGVRYPSLPD